MAWQKNKIWMVFKGTHPTSGTKVVHKRAVNKSKGTGKNTGGNTKLVKRMFCKLTGKHEEYKETKFK